MKQVEMLKAIAGLLCLLLTACTAGITQQETAVLQTTVQPADAATDTPTILTLPPPTEVTATPTQAATAEAGPEPIIRYFRASVKKAATGDVVVVESDDPWPPHEKADPGDTVVLEWETAGAISATLTFSRHVPVEPTGTFTYETKPDQYGCVPFNLIATNEKGQVEIATIFIQFPCPNPLFFSSEWHSGCCGFCANYGCPEAAITSDAAEQHFEHGTMIWIKEWDRIYVLYEDVPVTSDQASTSFSNEWDESQPDHDPSLVPPDDLYQPVRGFGLVWRQHPEVRERLGWAVDQETAFVTTVQRVPSVGRHWSLYIRALDGDIWRLFSTGFGQSWEKITED
jgi:hypothetical protein